ncbi:MAG TPA: hypothetical protein VF069_03175 [Streptosporangiaceae bacterium]
MSEPQARGNGLSAEAYAALADLHPRVASEMLSALRDAGIAAYATPKSDLIDSMVAEGLADAPAVADRLYVDASMKSRAEQILESRLPQSGNAFIGESAESADEGRPAPEESTGGSSGPRAARDEDEIWAEIVASFDMEAPPPDAAVPWPEEENVPRSADGDDDAGSGQDRSGRLPTARVVRPADDDFPEPAFDDAEDDEDEGHFIPPPPPPLPNADPTTKAAWVALFGGPLYLLIAAVLGWEVPGWVAFLAVAAFVGGFVTLVLRMGDEPRDPDDGAVV